MKRIILAAGGLALCLMIVSMTVFALRPDTAMAETASTRDTITVSGTGTVEAKPEQAVVIMGASTENKDAKAASQENTKIMNAVIEALKKQGLKDTDMRTYQYSIDPVYNYNTSTPTVTGYRVSNLLSIVIADTTKVGDIIDAATTAGANQTNSITFQMKDTSAMYQQALTKAMENAKTSAATLAKAAGRSINVVVEVTENNDYYSPYERGYSSNVMSMADAGTPISSGTASVTATVSVTYSLK